MIFLIFGKQSLMVKSRLGKLIKERLDHIDEMNFVKFNSREVQISDIVAEATHLPIGCERKVIVADDCYYLSTSKTKEKIEKDQNYDDLVKYLKAPNESSDLIMTLISDKLNEKSEIVKLLKQTATIKEMVDIDKYAWPEYVKRYFENHESTIDFDAANELIARCQNDATLFVSEAQKLLLNGNHIKLVNVKTLVPRPLEENVFALSNAVIKKDIGDTIVIFRDLRFSNVEPVTLISMLEKQFRLMLQISLLMDQGQNQLQISKTLGIHEYRVKLAMNASSLFSQKRLGQLLDELFLLDFKIKSSQIDRFFGFELFLLNSVA